MFWWRKLNSKFKKSSIKHQGWLWWSSNLKCLVQTETSISRSLVDLNVGTKALAEVYCGFNKLRAQVWTEARSTKWNPNKENKLCLLDLLWKEPVLSTSWGAALRREEEEEARLQSTLHSPSLCSHRQFNTYTSTTTTTTTAYGFNLR